MGTSQQKEQCRGLRQLMPAVVLRVQDDEAFEVVPNSSFVITRTAHRSNKSDYYINDRKSNFTEVTDLLKGKGIDLDNNRFLILQVWCGRECYAVQVRLCLVDDQTGTQKDKYVAAAAVGAGP